MSRRCQVTGRAPSSGKNVSHSHVRTNRWFRVNVQSKRYWLPSENRWVRLRLSAKGIRTVDRDGVESVVARLRAAGEKV
ncbi:50S ribosomal protein L28 [Actinomycetospora soli]|uniref:50S ribosomal protein L28 n=1 Tax=Actinomycetospora soli TaxID=2893887 RepID=UPI001E4E4E57|nr:50S ribosomal protein L28 [Actinomycetospora soli]MCD2190376.1 50S ribosomal protein L28 [Actinomycetospora soli]